MTLSRREIDIITSAGKLPRLDLPNVVDAVERMSLKYTTLDNGSLRIVFETGMFLVNCEGENGEVLAIIGQWRATPSNERYDKLIALCNVWNSSRRWPKTYADVTDEGLRVYTEHYANYAPGVTVVQLMQDIRTIISASNSFFMHLKEELPEEWAAATAGEEGAS